MNEQRSVAVAQLSIQLQVETLDQLQRLVEALRGVAPAAAPAPAASAPAVTAPAAPEAAPRRRRGRPARTTAPASADTVRGRGRGRRAIEPLRADRVKLEEVLPTLPEMQRRLLAFLAANPGKSFTTDELLEPMGVTSRKMLGGRLTGFKKTIGSEGLGLVKQKWLGTEYSYWMEPEDAERVRQILGA